MKGRGFFMADLPSDYVFHLPRSWLGAGGSGVLPFYERLSDGLRRRGMSVVHVPLDRDVVMAHVASDTAFHVVNHGRFQDPRVLNAGIAYIYPFWNMDPLGIRAFSSIADQPFRPGQIDADAARPFFRRLRKRLVGGRTSRYPQPDLASVVPEDCIAVFMQSEAHRNVGETRHLTPWQMIETCVATGQPVVVKPHPRDETPETLARLNRMAKAHLNLTVSAANIHDILATAARVVTINSAVGVEAYLHRKPVILCGQADFHHIAEVAQSVDALADLLSRDPKPRAYAKYIHWYFAQMCLSTTEPDLTGRFLDRVAAALE